MSPSDIDLYAIQVENYLKSEGAVRISETEVADFRTVEQICDDLKICDVDFRRIKARMRRRGVPITYISNKGHFIGWDGEQIMDTVYRYKVSMGHAKNLKGCIEELKNISPDEKQWIERRSNGFEVTEEALEYANRLDQAQKQ